MTKSFFRTCSLLELTWTWSGPQACQLAYLCENWKWPLVSLTSIISASTWSNVKSKDSFEILRTSRFQNWPYYWWWFDGDIAKKQNVNIFLWTQCTYLRHDVKHSKLNNKGQKCHEKGDKNYWNCRYHVGSFILLHSENYSSQR